MPQVNPEIFHGKSFFHPLSHTYTFTVITSSAPVSLLVTSQGLRHHPSNSPGRVTSYGHIARLTGHPSHSRLVGSALKFLQDPTVPWHRVISASGAIADRGDGGSAAARQAQLLQLEGVTISQGRGEGVTVDFGHANPNARWKVNMALFGWFPDSVVLEGYDDELDRRGLPRQDGDEEHGADESDLSELTEEE